MCDKLSNECVIVLVRDIFSRVMRAGWRLVLMAGFLRLSFGFANFLTR